MTGEPFLWFHTRRGRGREIALIIIIKPICNTVAKLCQGADKGRVTWREWCQLQAGGARRLRSRSLVLPGAWVPSCQSRCRMLGARGRGDELTLSMPTWNPCCRWRRRRSQELGRATGVLNTRMMETEGRYRSASHSSDPGSVRQVDSSTLPGITQLPSSRFPPELKLRSRAFQWPLDQSG